MIKTLRVVAVSAPDWIKGKKGAKALNSRDPVSMFNATRVAAQASERHDSNPWTRSNWAIEGLSSASQRRVNRRSKTLLMYSLDDMDAFKALILKERPNLLLLGAMTICFPGAIACAKEARALLGNDVFIVLGGRHVNETMKANHASQKVAHLNQSPLVLMRDKKIDPVFDLCISGDGEYVIEALGMAIGNGINAYDYLESRQDILGEWLASYIDETGEIYDIVSTGAPIDYTHIPSPSLMFGVHAAFDVFNGRSTSV
jgi:hypothetical protein